MTDLEYIDNTDHVQIRSISKRFQVCPGAYVIIPNTLNYNEGGKYLLRIFTEKEADQAATMYANSNDSFLMSEFASFCFRKLKGNRSNLVSGFHCKQFKDTSALYLLNRSDSFYLNCDPLNEQISYCRLTQTSDVHTSTAMPNQLMLQIHRMKRQKMSKTITKPMFRMIPNQSMKKSTTRKNARAVFFQI